MLISSEAQIVTRHFLFWSSLWYCPKQVPVVEYFSHVTTLGVMTVSFQHGGPRVKAL